MDFVGHYTAWDWASESSPDTRVLDVVPAPH